MSYEKDLDYLKRELRNAQNIYDEAEKDERESDAEMWMNRVTHLEFQIEVFEKATKSDEYEAKAKAYNDTLKTLDKLINDDERYKEARSNDFIAGMLIAYENIFNLMEDYIKEGCE